MLKVVFFNGFAGLVPADSESDSTHTNATPSHSKLELP